MNTVVQGCKRPGVVYYLYDNLVTGSTREEQSQNLKNVVQRMQKFGLRLNDAKYKFFQNKLEFLAHFVTPAGIHPTDQRVDNILKAPTPICKSQLKSFLGLMTYNAKFLPSVASVLYPLYRLLRKDSRWKWTDTCQETFEKAKVLVGRSPVLVHYDAHKPLKLYCDPSPHGVGTCLMYVCNRWS